jgi:hypothetical protein
MEVLLSGVVSGKGIVWFSEQLFSENGLAVSKRVQPGAIELQKSTCLRWFAGRLVRSLRMVKKCYPVDVLML